MNHKLESILLEKGQQPQVCRYDTTLMAESKEKLKRLLMRVKEESEKFNIQKTEILASSCIGSWQIEEEK